MIHGPGGVTTYTDDNPAFRIYDIDYETGYPVKAIKYYFNITAANEGNPEWKIDFEMTEEYDMKDLSPGSFKTLTDRFLKEPEVVNQYFRNKHTKSDTIGKENCDTEDCIMDIYCRTSNYLYFEAKDCEGKKRIDFIHEFTTSLFETFFDPWVERVE